MGRGVVHVQQHMWDGERVWGRGSSMYVHTEGKCVWGWDLAIKRGRRHVEAGCL